MSFFEFFEVCNIFTYFDVVIILRTDFMFITNIGVYFYQLDSLIGLKNAMARARNAFGTGEERW